MSRRGWGRNGAQLWWLGMHLLMSTAIHALMMTATKPAAAGPAHTGVSSAWAADGYTPEYVVCCGKCFVRLNAFSTAWRIHSAASCRL